MRWLLLILAAALLSAAVPAADAPAGLIVYPRKTATGFALHVMNADGTGDRALPGQTDAVCTFPTWSPDGKRIAFMSAGAVGAATHGVSVINADGTGLVRVNLPAQRSGLPAWSPDGKLLALSTGDQRPNVVVTDALGNVVRQLNAEGTGAFGPFWMKDGASVGYTRIGADPTDVRLVLSRADGTGTTDLLPDAAFAVAGANALSPDGKKLLYLAMKMEDRTASLRLWDMAARSESALMELGQVMGEFETFPLPAWSPDGRWILLPLKTDQGIGLFRVSPDGKEKKRLTPEGVDCVAGSWHAPR